LLLSIIISIVTKSGEMCANSKPGRMYGRSHSLDYWDRSYGVGSVVKTPQSHYIWTNQRQEKKDRQQQISDGTTSTEIVVTQCPSCIDQNLFW